MTLTELLQILLPILGAAGLYIVNDLKKSVDRATDSLGELSGRVGIVIETTNRHEKEIGGMRESDEIIKNKLTELSVHVKSLPCRSAASVCVNER